MINAHDNIALLPNQSRNGQEGQTCETRAQAWFDSTSRVLNELFSGVGEDGTNNQVLPSPCARLGELAKNDGDQRQFINLELEARSIFNEVLGNDRSLSGCLEISALNCIPEINIHRSALQQFLKTLFESVFQLCEGKQKLEILLNRKARAVEFRFKAGFAGNSSDNARACGSIPFDLRDPSFRSASVERVTAFAQRIGQRFSVRHTIECFSMNFEMPINSQVISTCPQALQEYRKLAKVASQPMALANPMPIVEHVGESHEVSSYPV